ncbi:hypothetical protein EDD86DRAFT_211609 [Gorgonomyces haynaldii]|nr:hypothetical protein EDD86DRAFT_211609 [Gorgonomyces haynaldii]
MLRLVRQFNRLHIQPRQLVLKPLTLQLRTMATEFKKPKVASRRWLKPYKLKNHKGALARWILVGKGMFKRQKAGRNRLNRKNRARKKIDKRVRVLASKSERRLLKKLIPYHKKNYLK